MLFLVIAVIAALAIGGFAWWNHQRTQEAYQTLLQRDGLAPTSSPCGFSESMLVMLRACPKGDRRYGLKYGVTGQRTVSLRSEEQPTEVSAFVWWWEERHQSTDSKGVTTTSYSKKDRVVGAVRLPAECPAVSIAPEAVLTRFGIGGRSDFQLESEDFNRRFDVRTHPSERSTVIRLFDAQFQRFLLEMFDKRHIEIMGNVLLVAGDPPGRDGDLHGDIAELPGAIRDAALVASRIPDGFWRALEQGTGGAA